MKWNVEELLEYLETFDESQRVEAKAAKRGFGKSALETISAFSNEPGLGGGFLILGAREAPSSEGGERYLLQGVDFPDSLQQEIVGACRESFNVAISPEIQLHQVDGKILIIVFIPEASPSEKPVYVKKKGIEQGAFRRIGSADYRCSAEDLGLLFQLRKEQPFEQEVLPGVSWEDIDPSTIEIYRRRRYEVDPNAQELNLPDQELLLSLRCLVRKHGQVCPNVAGLVLFGSKMALRRMLPLESRVDYVITGGSDWVSNPSSRHVSLEYRESLLTLFPRLHSQIMEDLPVRFHLDEGKLNRTDIPTLPRNVIREALANAVMHRDYQSGQPTLIVRYSNRLEFRNSGYSLKPIDQIEELGSNPRNKIIASVFHDLRYAENKGTGIVAMKDWMTLAGLTTPPILESERLSNEFNLVLLPHHLLNEQNLRWLAQIKGVSLSDPERQALVLARELKAITNQDFRQINGTDTLTSSCFLRRLRDLGLLVMKGSGSKTYYVLAGELEKSASVTSMAVESAEGLEKSRTSQISLPDMTGAPNINPQHKVRTPNINPQHKARTPNISTKNVEFPDLPSDFPQIPEQLKDKIISLPKRAKNERIKALIRELCLLGPLQPSHLGDLLGKDPQYLRNYFLYEMLRQGEIEYVFPDNPAHPKQAYRVPSSRED